MVNLMANHILKIKAEQYQVDTVKTIAAYTIITNVSGGNENE